MEKNKKLWHYFRNISCDELNTIYHMPSPLRNNSKFNYLETAWYQNIDRLIYRSGYIPIFDIIDFLEIKIILVKQPGWDAAFKIVDDEAFIYLDDRLSIKKQRFMAAIMLGNILIGNKTEGSIWFLNNNSADNRIYYWAVNLLIPKYKFRAAYKLLPYKTISTTRKIKGYFNSKINEENESLKNKYRDEYYLSFSNYFNVPGQVMYTYFVENIT